MTTLTDTQVITARVANPAAMIGRRLSAPNLSNEDREMLESILAGDTEVTA